MEMLSTPPKSSRGRKSLLPLITINKRYGRIYFSAHLVKKYALLSHTFAFVRLQGSWHLEVLASESKSIQLQRHNGSFYFLNKQLVEDLVDAFNCSQSIEVLVDEAVADENIMPLSFFRERPQARKKKRKSNCRPHFLKQPSEAKSAAQFDERPGLKSRVQRVAFRAY